MAAGSAGATFVTGGSGFIGGRLIARLVGDGGRVRALARSDSAAAAVEALGAEAVRGDLSDAASMQAGAEGCDTAFHLAAHLAQWGKREDFIAANVTGTENALAACRDAGVLRFVHCGTEAALLAGQPLLQVDETAPLRPDSKALYSATKAIAEQRVRAGSDDGFDAMVMRPRLVWGAGDTTLLPEIVAAVRGGKFAWIGGGGHLTATTHVDNVVEGLLLTAEKGRAGEAYFVTDGEPVGLSRVRLRAARHAGCGAADAFGTCACGGDGRRRFGDDLARAAPRGEPPLTRLALWLSSQECTIDISKARAQLGYEPVRTRADGMAELGEAAAA